MDELGPELRASLSGRDYAALLLGAVISESGNTHAETIMMIKAPDAHIQYLRGNVRTLSRMQLIQTPIAPVFRYVMFMLDQEMKIVAVDCFLNIKDESQFMDFERLAGQDMITVFFYNAQLERVLAKRFMTPGKEKLHAAFAAAVEIARAIPEKEYDFDIAKEIVMREITLSDEIADDVARRLFSE